MLLSYTLFNLALSVWTMVENQGNGRTVSETLIFLSASVGLLLLSTIVSLFSCANLRLSKSLDVLYIVFVFFSIGCSLQYSHGQIWEYVTDIGYGLLTFIITYLLMIYLPVLRWCKSKICVFITAILIQSCIYYCAVLSIGAKISGKGITAVVSLPGGFLLYASVLLLWPFFVAGITEIRSGRRFGHTIYALQYEYGVLLIYFLIAGVGLCLCKELTLFAVLGVTVLSEILLNVRSRKFKFALLTIGVTGSLFIVNAQPYIRNRVFVWLHIDKAIHMPEFEATATSTAYYLTHTRRGGWYGEGLGAVSKTMIPTALTDHVFGTAVVEYGLIFGILMLLLILLLAKKLFYINASNTYEYQLAFISLMITLVSFGLSMAGSVGSFLVSGISIPYLTGGGSLQILFAYLLAVNIAIKYRGEIKEEEETTC